MLRWFCLWGDELPQSRLRRASPLWDGAFGMAAQFSAKPQSLPLPLKPSPLGGTVAANAVSRRKGYHGKRLCLRESRKTP